MFPAYLSATSMGTVIFIANFLWRLGYKIQCL